MNLSKPFLNLCFSLDKLKNNTILKRLPILSRTFLWKGTSHSFTVFESIPSQLFLVWRTLIMSPQPLLSNQTRMTFLKSFFLYNLFSNRVYTSLYSSHLEILSQHYILYWTHGIGNNFRAGTILSNISFRKQQHFCLQVLVCPALGDAYLSTSSRLSTGDPSRSLSRRRSGVLTQKWSLPTVILKLFSKESERRPGERLYKSKR